MKYFKLITVLMISICLFSGCSKDPFPYEEDADWMYDDTTYDDYADDSYDIDDNEDDLDEDEIEEEKELEDEE